MKGMLLKCLMMSLVFVGACRSGPPPLHPVTYRDVMVIPTGSRIVFPEKYPVRIGQLGDIEEFTTDRENILFSREYFERVIEKTLEGLE